MTFDEYIEAVENGVFDATGGICKWSDDELLEFYAEEYTVDQLVKKYVKEFGVCLTTN